MKKNLRFHLTCLYLPCDYTGCSCFNLVLDFFSQFLSGYLLVFSLRLVQTQLWKPLHLSLSSPKRTKYNRLSEKGVEKHEKKLLEVDLKRVAVLDFECIQWILLNNFNYHGTFECFSNVSFPESECNVGFNCRQKEDLQNWKTELFKIAEPFISQA